MAQKVLSGVEADKLHTGIVAELARRAALHGDILEWGRLCFPEKFPRPFCKKMHEYFVSIRSKPFTNTEAPRSHAKTTIKCFLIPIFQALNETYAPDDHAKYRWKVFRHYLNVQATEEKSLAVNNSIKCELEQNAILRELYGDMTTKERWTGNQFVLSNGVVFTAIGAGQSVRGINYRNSRPDYIIIDDLYDEEDINNSESTEKKSDWFWNSLYPCRAQDRDNSIHIQGTAINAEDLMEKLKNTPGVISATFQAITDWGKHLVLWPELKTDAYESLLRDHELMGSLRFFREMQNERRDDSTSIVKRAFIENWEYDPQLIGLGERVPVWAVILGCDPSIGTKVENDPTAIALVYRGRLPGDKWDTFFIAALVQGHWSLDLRIKKVQTMAIGPGGLKATKAHVEAISGFQDFTSALKNDPGTTFAVDEVKWVHDKISVLEGKSVYFENRRVRISKDIPENLRGTLAYQLTTNHPKNDDLRDALLLCLDDTGVNLDWI